MNSTDPSGSRPIWDRMREGGSIGYTDSDSEPSHAVVYGVPYYNQGNSELCWAFCQTMIEDYENKTMRSNDEATARAVEIAKSRVSPGKKWNVGGWPGNYDKDKEIRIFHSQEVFSVLLIALKNGPAYAFYCNGIPGTTTHLVVVTGLDISNGLVYTNDPLNSTGRASVQSIDEFFRGSASAGAGSGKPLYWIAPIY